MEKINKLVIIGGIYGNEFIGIYFVKKFEKFFELIIRKNFEIKILLVNF